MKRLLFIPLGTFLSSQLLGADLNELKTFNAQLTELTRILQQATKERRAAELQTASLQKQLEERRKKLAQTEKPEEKPRKEKTKMQEEEKTKREITGPSTDDIRNLIGYHDALEEQIKKNEYQNAQISLQIFTDLVTKIGPQASAMYLEIKNLDDYLKNKRIFLEEKLAETFLKRMEQGPRQTVLKSIQGSFRFYPGFGGELLLGLPGFGTYLGDRGYPLWRQKALIELRNIPEDIVKKFPPSGETHLYIALWLNDRAQSYYNFIPHPAVTAWENPNILTADFSQIINESTRHLTDLGKKLLFFPKEVYAAMGLIPISEGLAPVSGKEGIPFNTINPHIPVSPHPDGKDPDAIRFSPNWAQFHLAADKPVFTFWTYLSYKGHTIIMLNIVLNIFNIQPAAQPGTSEKLSIENFLDLAIQESAGNLRTFEQALTALSKLFKIDIRYALDVLQKHARR